ncbi:MAG TPA: GNAT family N-acetyltransferase [Thermoanaerobaculia bacterium]|nr:GNAT family N-acetyltransferase [Thermoanaerobaculia bacterium]
MSARIALRPAVPADGDLLFRIYASTRAEELAAVPWTEDQKRAFLFQQFDAQSRNWAKQYRDADFRIIEVDGEPAGRFYVHRGAREIRLVDIALLPEYRGAGTGTELLRELLGEARSSGRTVTLHVEVFNPARKFYERLGFRAVEDRGAYLLMRWCPPGAGGELS